MILICYTPRGEADLRHKLYVETPRGMVGITIRNKDFIVFENGSEMEWDAAYSKAYLVYIQLTEDEPSG